MRIRHARTEVSLWPWGSGRVRRGTDGSLPPPSQAGWPPDGPGPHEEGQSVHAVMWSGVEWEWVTMFPSAGRDVFCVPQTMQHLGTYYSHGNTE